MKAGTTLQTAYKNEYSNYYDRMPYGSAASLEQILELTDDWHGCAGVGFAYDLGLTGLIVDHGKARAYYHKAEELCSRTRDKYDRISIREFRYARHMTCENFLYPVTDRMRAVFRVLFSIVQTSRGEGTGLLEVAYTSGLAYSYQLANIVKNIPYEKDPARQTGEDRAIAAVVEPMIRIMEIYSRQDVGVFKEILASAAAGADAGSDVAAGAAAGDDSGAGADFTGANAGTAFLGFLVGVMLLDTYRCPIDKEKLAAEVAADYRKEGAKVLMAAARNGCVAAFLYLCDVAEHGSYVGSATVMNALKVKKKTETGAAAGLDLIPAITDRIADPERRNKAAAALRSALQKHLSGEDRTGDYLMLL